MAIDPTLIASIGQAFLAGQGRGLEEALIMDAIGRDVATRNALAQYVASPEAERRNALNQVIAADPATASTLLTLEQTQNELARLERQEQARREYAAAQHVLTSDNPALALRLLDEDGRFQQQLIDAGLIDPEDGISDEEARLIAQWAADTLAPLATEGERTDTFGRKLGTVETYLGRRLTDEEVLKLAGGGTTINIGDKLNEPIPVSQIQNVRLPDGSPVPIGTTFQQAREMGAQVVSPAEQQRGLQQEAALAILDEVEQLALGPGGLFTNVEPGFVNRAGAALLHGLSMLTQDDPSAALYEDRVRSSLAPIVRLFGETGALAEGDVQRALGSFPRTFPLPDTREVAQQKLRRLREYITIGLRNYNKIQAGEMEPLTRQPSSTTRVQDMSDEEILSLLQQMERGE